jgi:hypothetical protein
VAGEEGVELQQGRILQMLEEQLEAYDRDLAEALEAQLLWQALAYPAVVFGGILPKVAILNLV